MLTVIDGIAVKVGHSSRAIEGQSGEPKYNCVEHEPIGPWRANSPEDCRTAVSISTLHAFCWDDQRVSVSSITDWKGEGSREELNAIIPLHMPLQVHGMF